MNGQNTSTHNDDSEDIGISSESNLFATNTDDKIAGKLESIQMINFMCHSNLEIKFNQRVTFLSGKNGSGKSTVLAALIIALGGSASHTNRACSLTDFIKKGESWSVISLSILNEGYNAFKSQIYGSRVIISRIINASGKHAYICKSMNELVVSRKKEEVDSIVEAFNYQIKNPICILNQDVARSFLCATDNSLRFALFSQATQLEKLKLLQMSTLEILTNCRDELCEKRKATQEARAEIKKLKAKLKLFASLEERVNERTSLENEYFWSLVVNEEQKLQKLVETKNELLEKKEEYSNEESEFEEKLGILKDKLKEYEIRFLEARDKKSKKSTEKDEVQKKVQYFEKEEVKTKGQLRVLEEKIQEQLVNINGVKQHLQECDNAVIQSPPEKKEKSEKATILRQRLSDIKEEMASTHKNLKKAERTVYLQSKNLEYIKADLVELEQNKKRLEISLGEAKAKGQNNYTKFGCHTQELLQAIEEATKKNYFLRRPIGPLGIHVRLTGDIKWARPVEFAIGGLMTTYRCDSQKDFQVLSKIMDKICGKKKPTIIIGKFLQSRHNVETKKASVRGFQSVLDVLTFDNDVVFNTFVDQAQIEGILLFENDEQAAAILTNIQNVPKNVKMGLTLQSDQYYPAPNYRTYYGDSTRPLKYFDAASKMSDAVKKLEIEIKEASRTITEKNLELEKAREASRETSALVDRCQDRLKDLKQEEGNIEVELNHLKDTHDTRPVSVRKAALEEELGRLIEEHKVLLEERNQCRQGLEELKERQKEWEGKLNAMAVDMDEAEKNTVKWEGKFRKKKSKHTRLLKERTRTSEKLEEISRKLNEVTESIREGEAAVEKKIKEAEEVCLERIETKKSPVEVQKLLEDCEKDLKAAEEMAESRQATIEEYKTKYSLFKEMKSVTRLLENLIEKLTTASFNKEQMLKIVQSHTSNLVSLYFQAGLQTRGYDGQLKVNFEEKVLDLEVKPKDATIARSDSKTLSGGERSYSMVSLILAIWKVVNMPFYFLDEFDVFMDRVNRKVIMDLLLEHASVQSNKQFIFITPQDISDIQPSDIITVYKMPDPERRIP